MAELAKPGATILVERSGTLLAEHAPPAPPTSMDYPNERAALAIFRKRITELVVAGWQLSRGDADIGGPIAVDPAVEAALRERFDLDQLAVYNDWLIEHGDPCGEAATLRARGADVSIFEAERAHELYGSFADLLAEMPTYTTRVMPLWSHGWIEGWRLERLNLGTLIGFALHAPLARFAHRLVVWHGVHAPTVRYALARSSRRSSIRALVLTEHGMAAQLLKVLPAIETLTMPSSETTEGHARVRELVLEVHPRLTTTLFTGAWPALEHLTIRAPRMGGNIVARLLQEAPLEKLRALRHVDVDAELDPQSLDRIQTRLRGFTT